MKRKSFAAMSCSVAQCLEVIGERWTMLIVRDAFLGVRRFDDFQQRLAISTASSSRSRPHDRAVDATVLERLSPPNASGQPLSRLVTGLIVAEAVEHEREQTLGGVSIDAVLSGEPNRRHDAYEIVDLDA